MKATIDLQDHQQLLGLAKNHPKFPVRLLRNKRKYALLYCRREDSPLQFYIADVYLGKKCVAVMSSPWDKYWYPIVTEDGVPLYVHGLIDRGFLEERHRNPQLWRG